MQSCNALQRSPNLLAIRRTCYLVFRIILDHPRSPMPPTIVVSGEWPVVLQTVRREINAQIVNGSVPVGRHPMDGFLGARREAILRVCALGCTLTLTT